MAQSSSNDKNTKSECSYSVFAKYPNLTIYITAIVMLFLNLGVKGISGSEARWTCVVREMFFSGDFWHPTVNFVAYFDKPLVSYWTIALASLPGADQVSLWAARLPSALAALITLYATIGMARVLWNERTARAAGWLFLTFYAIAFWGRLAEADMQNLAFGTLALYWYTLNRDKTSLLSYLVFGLLCAVGGQTKGLSAIAVPVLVVGCDVVLRQTFVQHLNWRLPVAVIISIGVYLFPFLWAAGSATGYADNGLYLVFRENIMRYFNAFDHIEPWYAYFEFLPRLVLPWTPFMVLALCWAAGSWKKLDLNERWIWVASIAVFVIFSCSESKRVYYILPILPLMALLTARYFLSDDEGTNRFLRVILVLRMPLLKLFTWLLVVGALVLIITPAVWLVIRGWLPQVPEAVADLLLYLALPSGAMLLGIVQVTKLIGDVGRQKLTGVSLLAAPALGTAWILIVVFAIVIPYCDVKLRTEQAFFAEVGMRLTADNVKPEQVAFLSTEPYINATYYLNLPGQVMMTGDDVAVEEFLNGNPDEVRYLIFENRKLNLLKDEALKAHLTNNVVFEESLNVTEKAKDKRKKHSLFLRRPISVTE